jgi:uncharacterized membrane protein
MRATLPVLRCVLLLSLAGSAVSLADDTFADRPFCGFESGCDAVTGTPYGRPLGVPLAAVGLGAFAGLFVLTLFPAARSFALVAPAAALAGAAGLSLVGIQAFVLDRFCPVCLFVDGTAVAAAGVALVGRVWRAAGSGAAWPTRGAWLGGAVAAAGVPMFLGWAMLDPDEPTPQQVSAYWVEGAVTLVEVTDFDCQYCRQAEPVVAAFRRAHPEVRFVRVVAPMPLHPQARPAGRAFLAARAQDREEEMAALLMAADSRSPERCRELAAQLRLNLDEYDRVVNDPGTQVRLDATVEWVRTAGTGLPLVWVQGKRIQGNPTAAALEAALARARAG